MNYEVRATMDAGMAAISSVVGVYETEAHARDAAEYAAANGFWGDAKSFISSNPETETVFFCPRYIKRVIVKEISSDS
ncbi:hypothetical protein LCGC14_2316560 [marine sediment metagenome]|uniref:Uncharacterized protein n=1 Tax=marine sediment metagenome TaxID=412755 RepID=A0A0F9CJ81_9ZZZZ